jgi:hypothetical protein
MWLLASVNCLCLERAFVVFAVVVVVVVFVFVVSSSFLLSFYWLLVGVFLP